MNVNLKGTFLASQAFHGTQWFSLNMAVLLMFHPYGESQVLLVKWYIRQPKGGLNAFTKALAKELAPSGVTVNAVAPGAVDTDMMDRFAAEEVACDCERNSRWTICHAG